MSTIGYRIRVRREELGLSQEELGKRLGYKSRSSINKIELDQRNLTQPKIKAIADALETTPAYIMGWTIPKQNTNTQIQSEQITLSSHEINLIKKYRALDERGKQAVDDTLEREYDFVKPKAEESAIS